jgi:putative multiple sugar transport system substrate-binding protein
VAMPTKSSERWIADGNNIKSQLEDAGYDVDLQYAEDDIPTQVSQVENMITKEVDVLVIAAIDGTALGDVLGQAEDLDIPVISYDRLIRDSEAVDYYSTFDNFKVGVLQGQSLVDGLKEKGKPPYNIELFAGSPDDNNAKFFFDGAMSVLQPMIDSGDMKVVSGQTDFEQVAILRWDPATAQKRMEDILTSTYTGGDQVQGVLSPYDGLSLGIIAALKANGYGGAELPVVTGQDAELASVKSIMAGEQYSTIYKDTRELAKVTVDMIKAVEAGEEPKVNDTETYDNGVKVVPSYLLDPVPVTKDDVQKVLVDSGYYKDSDLK